MMWSEGRWRPSRFEGSGWPSDDRREVGREARHALRVQTNRPAPQGAERGKRMGGGGEKEAREAHAAEHVCHSASPWSFGFPWTLIPQGQLPHCPSPLFPPLSHSSASLSASKKARRRRNAARRADALSSTPHTTGATIDTSHIAVRKAVPPESAAQCKGSAVNSDTSLSSVQHLFEGGIQSSHAVAGVVGDERHC